MDSVERRETPDERIQAIRLAIRLMIMVIFLGYIMIWIMMPTNIFWIHWQPDIYDKVNSTYFGNQGANLLIYTFPILLISVLGCLYLHLGKKHVGHNNGSTTKNYNLALWRRPAIVKGPLGIVSWTEVFFLSTFTALLLWSFSFYVHLLFANITRESAPRIGKEIWEVKLVSTGRLTAFLGSICLAFLFFPVTRSSSILRLFGLSSESSIKYHIWLGHIVMTLFMAHSLCYIIIWINANQISEMLKWEKVWFSNVAGEIALLSGLAMWSTTFPWIRRKMFELFFYTHYLYILFIVFFVFHVGFSYFCITLPGFYLFLIDRYLRFLQSQQKVRLVSARILPCQAVELNFSKSPGLSYNPTSSMFINVPGISKLQWHPFTVTSNNNIDPDRLSIAIKSEGRWSQTLYEKLSQSHPLDHLEFYVEGPYGPASTHFLRHDTLVMISGGSGITPFSSITRELLFNTSTRSCSRKQFLLITAFKKSVDLTMLDLLLPESGTNYDITKFPLRIDAYITREKAPTSDDQKLCQTVWFKPRAMDSPVSAILGSNSWLWLGAIISSSFLTFLLLIGIITRYYIYPIDHNTNMIFSYGTRSALNMLSVCTSIAMTGTTVFIWNKKQNAKETREIQNFDMLTPIASQEPGSGFYDGERELESFPHQSFFQNAKVHYGERPNFKKLLEECEGSSIGVLVCGPEKMRQEVAAICSSSEANNLYFESISFSW